MWRDTPGKERELLLGIILGTQVRPGGQLARIRRGAQTLHHLVSLKKPPKNLFPFPGFVGYWVHKI